MERRKIVLGRQIKKNKSHTPATIQMIKDENEMAIGYLDIEIGLCLYVWGRPTGEIVNDQ